MESFTDMIVNYINWNIDPEIFNLFGISLLYYGVRILFWIGNHPDFCSPIFYRVYQRKAGAV